jgi:hypothetical protein
MRKACIRRLWKWATLFITPPPLGETGGGSFTEPFERQMKEGSGNGARLIKLIWAHFLDPGYFGSLSLSAIWNFCEGPGLP